MRDPVTGKEIPVAGQAGALPPPSAPPPSGSNIANVAGAPLSQNGANESQGGGAVPAQQAQGGMAEGQQPGGPGFDPMKDRPRSDQMIDQQMQSNPDALLAAAEQSVEAIANVNANSNEESSSQMRQMARLVEGQGVVIKPTFEEMRDKVEMGLRHNVEAKRMTEAEARKARKGWRKIFNTIHEDEMGLFLIDFGLRAMMAGEEMGDVAALGAAGSGAMGALQGRRQTEIDAETALTAEAHKRTVEQMDAESGRMTSEAQTVTAAARATTAKNANRPYSGLQKFQLDLARKVGAAQGRSSTQIEDEMLRFFMGEESDPAQRQYWQKHFGDMVQAAKKESQFGGNITGIYVDENGKNYAEYTSADIVAAAEQMLISNDNLRHLNRAASGAGIGQE